MDTAPGFVLASPYQVLQLHPSAPRELIDEAYWALVEHVRTARASSASEQLLSALNAAYAALSNADRRRDIDETLEPRDLRPVTLRLRRSGIWPLSGDRISADHRDLYQLLRVDRHADAMIVTLAHRVLSGRASGTTAEAVYLRRLLQDAHDVLANPMRRAAYDAAIGIKQTRRTTPAAASDEPESAETPPRPEAAAEPPPVEPDIRVEVSAPVDVAEPSIEAHISVEAEPGAEAAAVTGTAAAEAHAAIETADGLEVEASVEEAAPDAPGEPASPSDVEQNGGRDAAAAAPARADDSKAAWELRVRAWLGALRGAASAGLPAEIREDEPARRRPNTTEEAEQRLRGLRNGHDVPASEPAAAAINGNDSDSAGLTFIDGPRAGTTVSLGTGVVTFGSGPDADVVLNDEGVQPRHARIWQLGDRFVLRSMAENGTLVGGEPISLGLVVLDHGDEIEIGAHRLRFSLPVLNRELQTRDAAEDLPQPM